MLRPANSIITPPRKPKNIFCLLNILVDNTIRMVVRDTGVQFDPSNADMEVSSLSSYVISTVAERLSSRKLHLATMSFNRNMFELKTARGTE